MFLKTDGTPLDVKGGEGEKTLNDEFANRDKRLSWTVLGPGYKVLTSGEMKLMPMECNYSMTGYMLVKWLMPNRVNFLSGQDNNSILIFRYPEVLLNYAEAMNEAYGPDAVPAGFTMSARQALQQVRDSDSG